MDKRAICVIRGLSILSSLGVSTPHDLEYWRSALKLDCAPWRPMADDGAAACFPLAPSADDLVGEIAGDDPYRRLDRTALLAIAAARGTLAYCGQRSNSLPGIGCVTIGSSRGATTTLEQSIRQFDAEGRVGTLTSPITTAGNVSSWVAQEYLRTGASEQAVSALAVIGTSMTCTSAFHSLLVARSFVLSGMAECALFGGSEACLTPFTVAQLRALRIYGSAGDAWPCRPLCSQSAAGNTVVLGEGAGTAVLLSADSTSELQADDLVLEGIGWSIEPIPSPTGLSPDGAAFAQAMRMAIAAARPEVRLRGVVTHAPGSRVGDDAELAAIRGVCGDVAVYSTKHLTGHTYGASGMVSLSLASALLAGVAWPGFPYKTGDNSAVTLQPGEAILVNSAGFGGNAISVLVARAPTAKGASSGANPYFSRSSLSKSP